MEKNQIRVLCNNCGCYYYWDIEFEFDSYGVAVNAGPKESGKCCPECGSQEVASHAHHSAAFFNCEAVSSSRLPRYFSGSGCGVEPILAKEKEVR